MQGRYDNVTTSLQNTFNKKKNPSSIHKTDTT